MKLLTFPIKLLIRLVILPIKLVLATAGLTFRAGFKAGTLPVKGSVVAGRALGLKALVLFAAGVALGVFVGRKLGSMGAQLAEASYPDSFGGGTDRGPAVAVATYTEDSLELVDTPDGPVVELIEDTIEVIETADGDVVTETVTITELDADQVEAILEAEALAEAEEEMLDEVEAEIDQALGFTGGELGVDAEDGDA
jgi:hypothetical protein